MHGLLSIVLAQMARGAKGGLINLDRIVSTLRVHVCRTQSPQTLKAEIGALSRCSQRRAGGPWACLSRYSRDTPHHHHQLGISSYFLSHKQRLGGAGVRDPGLEGRQFQPEHEKSGVSWATPPPPNYRPFQGPTVDPSGRWPAAPSSTWVSPRCHIFCCTLGQNKQKPDLKLVLKCHYT